MKQKALARVEYSSSGANSVPVHLTGYADTDNEEILAARTRYHELLDGLAGTRRWQMRCLRRFTQAQTSRFS
jgi:hypothetical protein